MSYLGSEKSNILIREIIISIQASHQSLIKYVFTLYKNKSKGNPKDILQDCSKYDLGMYIYNVWWSWYFENSDKSSNQIQNNDTFKNFV